MFFILVVVSIVQAGEDFCNRSPNPSCSKTGTQNAGKPVIYHFLVFGPSQFGKSTFINKCLDKARADCERAVVGDGTGISITLEVETYTMEAFKELLPHSRAGYDIIKIFDVPGLFDSELRIDKKEIFAEIKKTLLQSGANNIDGIFLFESVKDDSRKMLITLDIALQLFGEDLVNSSILLTTKWDRLIGNEFQKVESTVEAFATNSGIQTQKWYINHEHFNFSENQMDVQFSELGSRIGKLKKFKVDEMDDLLQRRDILAEQLRERDPNRFATKEYEQEVQEAEDYIEDEPLKVTEWVALSTEEIEIKAKKMFDNQIPIPGQLIPRKVIRQVTKDVVNYVPEVKTENKEYSSGWWLFKKKFVVPIQTIKFNEVLKKVTEDVVDYEFDKGEDIKMNLEYFSRMLDGQMKPEVVEKIIPTRKVRIRPVMKKIKVNQDRYDFEHYQKLAVEEMQKGLLNSIRFKQL